MSTNPFYLRNPVCSRRHAEYYFCFFFVHELTRPVQFSSVQLSSMRHTIIRNHRSKQSQNILLHVMLLTFTCYTCFAIDAGRDFHESVQLHRNRADEAHLIISLTLWKRGIQTQSDTGCFTGCSPILLLNSVCYKMSFFFSPIYKSSYRKSVCRIQPWLLCCELALFDQLSDTCT